MEPRPRDSCLSFLDSETRAQSIREKMQKALSLQQAGEEKADGALFPRSSRNNPQHGPARLQLGRIALSRGELDSAQEHLEIATVDGPHRVFLACYLLGRVHFLKGDYERAKESFHKAIEKAPAFKPAWLMLAETAETEGDLWEALRILREILEQAPTETDVLAKTANLAREMGASELAETAARRAIAAQPDNGSFYFLLAVIQKDSGQIDAALASCELAVELGYREAPVYKVLGDLYYENQEMTQSIASLAKAVELDPTVAETIASFALSSLTTEDFSKLLTLLEKHIETHPDNLNTLYSLGTMYLRENELGKAKETFLRLKEVAPEHTQVHYNLGLIYVREGNVEEGQAAMARFQELKVKENEEFTRSNLGVAKRQEAADFIAAGEVEKAIPVYTEMMREGLASRDDVLSLCNAYHTVGQNDPAFSCFSRVLENSPYEKEALEGLAQSAAALQKTEIAEQCRYRLGLLSPPEPPSHE